MLSNSLYSQSDREIISFNKLFKRYGLQADSTRVKEPDTNVNPALPSPKEMVFDDNDWRKLDVPHDWEFERSNTKITNEQRYIRITQYNTDGSIRSLREECRGIGSLELADGRG